MNSVTFSFESDRHEAVKARETFTLKELGLEGIEEEALLKKEIERVFRLWVERELNISWSIIIEQE